MRLAAVGFAVLAITAPAGAQSRSIAPAPRSARLVWAQTPVDPFIQDTLPRATTGAGKGTWIGAAVGGFAGLLLGRLTCAYQAGSCTTPQVLGTVLGAFTGAMIGSAFEGDQTPKPAPLPAEPPPP